MTKQNLMQRINLLLTILVTTCSFTQRTILWRYGHTPSTLLLIKDARSLTKNHKAEHKFLQKKLIIHLIIFVNLTRGPEQFLMKITRLLKLLSRIKYNLHSQWKQIRWKHYLQITIRKAQQIPNKIDHIIVFRPKLKLFK